MLTRRVPSTVASTIPSSPPPPSIPSVVQRALGGTVPRPASPASSVTSGPPSRPGSPSTPALPYKPRVASRPPSPNRSTFTTWTATAVNRAVNARQPTDLSVDLIAEVLNRDEIRVGEPFSVVIKPTISTATPPTPGKLRRLKVAAQHVISFNPAGIIAGGAVTRQGSTLPLNLALFSPRTPALEQVVESPHTHVPSGPKRISMALPSPYSPDTPALPASVTVMQHARTSTIGSVTSGGGSTLANRLTAALHPVPTTSFTGSVEFLGSSITSFAPIILRPEAGRWTGEGEETLQYLTTKEGLAVVGGLRILLLVDEEVANTNVENEKGDAEGQARILHEWGTIGEVWVMP
jgi:hypothetical protein